MLDRKLLTDIGLAILLAAPSLAIARPAEPVIEPAGSVSPAAVDLAEAVEDDGRESRTLG